jgi:hypothetical protein
MKEDTGKDLLFILYIAAAGILALLYFTVPERRDFFHFELKWWREFVDVLASFFMQ